MKKIITLAFTGIVVGLAAPAQAESNFEGPWIGVLGGYDRIGIEDENVEINKDGILYGVAAGYNVDLGSAIAGVEFEWSDSDTSVTANGLIVANDSLKIRTDRDLYAGVRLGLPVTESLMLYAKGGYSHARIKSTYTAGTTVEQDKATSGGYRLGAGAEYSLGKPFARLEYRYSNYGDFDDSGVKTDRHQVALTAGIRF